LGTAADADKQQGVILEMCYHPTPWTEIAHLASAGGWKVILGSEALIWQGLEQARLWTGKDVTGTPGLVKQVKDLVAKTIAERESAKSSL
jgi:quinate dehydrogenase